VSESDSAWSSYFNYFTEVEEHFQKARGTSLFLLSPLDWALIESWKNSGVPLEAALRGIDIAFEKWRAKRSRVQMVNSLAFCAQPVMLEAQRMADAGTDRAASQSREPQPSPFANEELRAFLERNASAVRATGVAAFQPVAASLGQIATELADFNGDLENLEQRLTVLEQKLVALARGLQTDEQALAVRMQLDSQLRPYRSKMTAPQIAMLEAQFLERALLEGAGLPRLSLFYIN
jgi:acyl transferase domain-containing protein